MTSENMLGPESIHTLANFFMTYYMKVYSMYLGKKPKWRYEENELTDFLTWMPCPRENGPQYNCSPFLPPLMYF